MNCWGVTLRRCLMQTVQRIPGGGRMCEGSSGKKIVWCILETDKVSQEEEENRNSEDQRIRGRP